MSHFTVAVVLPEYTKESLEQALQPFHEYECTGVKDEDVKFIPLTPEELSEVSSKYIEEQQHYELTVVWVPLVASTPLISKAAPESSVTAVMSMLSMSESPTL